MAIEDYDSAIELEPEAAAADNNRGVAYTSLGSTSGPLRAST
jgi:hypothetical protein